MTIKRIFALLSTTVMAGALLTESIGWAAAQEHPNGGMHGTADHGPGHGQQRNHDGPEHARMLATVAEALGLTVEDLRAALEAGKTVPQIAEEQGVELADLHETIMSHHQ